MFTIKYTDRDGLERLAQGRDIRVVKKGNQAESIGWMDCVAGEGCKISFPTTAYVMNETGATVGKYVVVGSDMVEMTRLEDLGRTFKPIAPDKRAGRT